MWTWHAICFRENITQPREMPSGRLTTKQDVVTTSRKRCRNYDVLKTSNWRLEDVWFTFSWRRLIYDVLKTSVNRRLCSNVVAKSMYSREKSFFSYFVLPEIFRKFWLFQFRLVWRYEILYQSMDWFIYDRNLCHERVNHLITNFIESEEKKESKF